MARLPDLIDTQPALDAALAALEEQPALAVDTESDAFFAYRPRICLVQVSYPGADLLVDPLAGLDLSGLGTVLADPGREVVFHAAENDVIMLKHEFGWTLGRLFDTQVACFVLGLPPYSLAGVLETRFGVKLDKSLQRSDWSQRPLSPDQQAYAAEDTCHLLELARDLEARAAEAGRTEEISWECRRIAERDWEPEPFDPEAFRKINGAKELDATAQRVLRDLFLFRNGVSEQRNRAPYRVAPDHALVALAKDGTEGPPRGVPKSFWRRYASDVRRVVQAARQRGPLPPRKRRRRDDGERTPPEAKRRYERLRRWRGQAAEERGVESFVVARNDLLLKVALADPATPDDLRDIVEPFRLEEYGRAMLDAMRDA